MSTLTTKKGRQELRLELSTPSQQKSWLRQCEDVITIMSDES